jgi:cell division protein FtsQ
MAAGKVNIKKVRNALIWSTLVMGIAVLLFISVRRKATIEVEEVVVDIIGIHGNERLISEKEIKTLIRKAAGTEIKGRNMRKLPLRKIEAAMNRDKRIQRADVYIDSKNRLHVRVEQKVPLMRVIETTGEQYYIDKSGARVPVTMGSAVRVPLVTGIRDTFAADFLERKRPSRLREVFHVVHFISKDAFLSALVEQIHVSADSTQDLIIVPKIGREHVVFGDASEMEDKFDKLKIFYRDGLPRLGWNRYKQLNVKISGQVVGTLTPTALAERQAANQDSLQASLMPKENSSSNASIHH